MASILRITAYYSTLHVHNVHGIQSDVQLLSGHSDGAYGVILRSVKAGCHPVAIAQVVEH